MDRFRKEPSIPRETRIALIKRLKLTGNCSSRKSGNGVNMASDEIMEEEEVSIMIPGNNHAR